MYAFNFVRFSNFYVIFNNLVIKPIVHPFTYLCDHRVFNPVRMFYHWCVWFVRHYFHIYGKRQLWDTGEMYGIVNL
jgi:hypothetical protein